MTISSAAQRIWLTPAARDRLEEELLTLREAVQETDDSADGNAGAVRRAQLGRIQEIHEMLVSAVVGEEPPNDGVAEPGMVLTVQFDDSEGDTETFLLGVRGADYGGIEVYSLSSPLGAAVNGARVGDALRYALPNGGEQTITLLRAVPYGLHD